MKPDRRTPVLVLLLLWLLASSLHGGIIEGYVFDMRSEAPIPFSTIQIVGSGKSTLANLDGRFQLTVPAGEYEIKVSHIGHYSKWLPVSVGDSAAQLVVYLPPTVIEVSDVVEVRAFDQAQRIINEAIKRKQAILRKLNDYSYDAYSKMVVWDESIPDSARMFMITETQSTSYWEYPDKYKEVLTARKQSANLAAEVNVVVVGEVLNFNKNRLDLNDWQVISPTAEDALDYYNYYLIDSTYIDDHKVYTLEVEPKGNADPLVIGTIQIVDSTFDVVSVDVGFNDVISVPVISELRYTQRSALFSGEYWMPVELGFAAVFSINFPGVPSPLRLNFLASLHSYSFEAGHPEGTFDEYVIEVLEGVDDLDSSAWFARQTIPLTLDEIRGYERIDSIESAPKPVLKQVLRGALAVPLFVLFGDYEFFHYNRVDGAYLGLPLRQDGLIPRTELWGAAGYGFDSELWQYRLGFRTEIDRERKLCAGAEYHRRLVDRKLVGKGWYNPTFEALFFKSDPFDYYWEKGFRLFAETKVLPHTRLKLEYNDFKQRSESVNTDYSLFYQDDEFRDNPLITDGNLRSVTAEFQYDSRKLWRNKGKDITLSASEYTLLTVGAELASPDFIDNDYDFRRYYASLFRRQRVPGLGVSSLTLYAGSATRALPPQKYYTVGFDDPFVVSDVSFLTVGDKLFYGNRVLLIHAVHDFDKLLWRKSRIPLIRDLPFTLKVYGGAFWTEFRNHKGCASDALLDCAPIPYSELGFSLGNLTPFIWPFNLSLYLTWQLSDYDTNDFTWMIGFDL